MRDGQREAEQRAAPEGHRARIAIAEHGDLVEVLLRRDREHERRDGQPEAPHTKRAQPDRTAIPATMIAASGMATRNGSDGAWKSTIHTSSSNPRSKGGREQGAESGERHLGERELARPSRDDRERHRADREAGDAGVDELRDSAA